MRLIDFSVKEYSRIKQDVKIRNNRLIRWVSYFNGYNEIAMNHN